MGKTGKGGRSPIGNGGAGVVMLKSGFYKMSSDLLHYRTKPDGTFDGVRQNE